MPKEIPQKTNVMRAKSQPIIKPRHHQVWASLMLVMLLTNFPVSGSEWNACSGVSMSAEANEKAKFVPSLSAHRRCELLTNFPATGCGPEARPTWLVPPAPVLFENEKANFVHIHTYDEFGNPGIPQPESRTATAHKCDYTPHPVASPSIASHPTKLPQSSGFLAILPLLAVPLKPRKRTPSTPTLTRANHTRRLPSPAPTTKTNHPTTSRRPSSVRSHPRHLFVELGIGLWPSRDPIGERGGINLYGFVGNNGVGRWDLLGLLGGGTLAGCLNQLEVAKSNEDIKKLISMFDQECPLDLDCVCCNRDGYRERAGYESQGKARICHQNAGDTDQENFNMVVHEELFHALQSCGKIKRPDKENLCESEICKELQAKANNPAFMTLGPEVKKQIIVASAAASARTQCEAYNMNPNEVASDLYDKCAVLTN